MKCPNCGAEAKGKFCEYCGSEMPKEKATINITNNYYVGTEKTQNNKVQNTTKRQTKGAKKRTWLWVLGWICIFPLPLTILLLRKKKMKPAIKYGVIAVAWLLFFVIGMSGNSETDIPQNDVPSHSESTQGTEDIDEPTNTSETEETEDTSPYPEQITSADYNGAECWLLNEPTVSGSEKVFDVYAVIDTSADDWQEKVKEVITLLWKQYGEEKVLFKIYNGTEGLEKAQPTYEDLIATWQNEPFSAISESEPTITWYPNGGGVAAQQETENWTPENGINAVVYAEDKVVNRFISEFNEQSSFEITDISQGNISTKYFGSANGRYLEMINANNAGAEAFCLTINGGQENADKQSMYEVFREAVKVLDPSITDDMIDAAISEFNNKDALIEGYSLGDTITITFVPIKELSYGKTSCRIDLYASNYK